LIGGGRKMKKTLRIFGILCYLTLVSFSVSQISDDTAADVSNAGEGLIVPLSDEDEPGGAH
jgi:hypothetical protein